MEQMHVADFLKKREEILPVVDVRVAEQFREGHLPEAVNIPLEELPQHLADFDTEETYYVICRSGNRSARATEFLTKNGIHAVNISEGMNAVPAEFKTQA